MAGTRAAQRTGNGTARLAAEVAEAAEIRQCLRWFARQKKWIDEKHLELCRIPAPTFQEQVRAAWMVERFRELGYAAETDRAGNVIATATANGQVLPVAVTAHLDTVLAPRTTEDIRVEGDGRFHGPGVSDNGAGLAALLALAGAAAETSSNELPLVFVANVGEEGEGNLSGMRYLCRPSGLAERVRAFLVVDGPATDHITCYAVASRRFEVVFQGPGGHSWSDFGCANPVHALARTISTFAEHDSNGANGNARSSFNFGIVEGGASINAIPTSARAKVDIRSESADRIDALANLLSSCVERALETEHSRSSAGRLTAKVREIGCRPGGRLSDDAPLLVCVRAADAHLGIRASLNSASTDANIPLALGLEALSIGGGGEGGGAHTPSEWYDPHGREIGLQRILLALALLART